MRILTTLLLIFACLSNAWSGSACIYEKNWSYRGQNTYHCFKYICKYSNNEVEVTIWPSGSSVNKMKLTEPLDQNMISRLCVAICYPNKCR